MTGSARADGSWPTRPAGIGEILVSSRSLAEYRAMFALTDADLSGRVLDCPGGASSFTAQAAAAGATAQACDPSYLADPGELHRRADTDRRRAELYVREHPDEYEWSFFPDPATRTARRRASLELFAQDYRTHPERYVHAGLPELPFADGCCDLVLCSHFLFAYADRFDLDFHVASLLEMARVSTGDVRVYPVFPMGSATALDLRPLRDLLAGHGVTTWLTRVDYQFQRGEPVMLVCRR